MITIENLNHSIAGAPILQDLTLSLPQNKLTALIGPNGAGKSTLVNLIGAQIPLQSGSIRVGELDTTTADRTALALKMALVAQQVGVASRLRVRDLVAFGRWPHCKGRPTVADTKVVDEALEIFHLTPLQNRFLDELSGGQRQNAFVAMAYAQDTDWLLLDEPLNNLDMPNARSLMTALHDLVAQKGKSIIMVVHDVNYASAWADHIVGLRKGQLCFEGAPEETLTQNGIKALYDMNAEVEIRQGKPVILHHTRPM